MDSDGSSDLISSATKKEKYWRSADRRRDIVVGAIPATLIDAIKERTDSVDASDEIKARGAKKFSNDARSRR